MAVERRLRTELLTHGSMQSVSDTGLHRLIDYSKDNDPYLCHRAAKPHPLAQ